MIQYEGPNPEMKKYLIILMSILVSIQSTAQVTSPFMKDQSLGSRAGFEYYVGKDLGSPLITVNLLSGVREPGVYHIPIHTDLAELVSYAGGATENADLTEIRVRRNQGKQVQLLEYNLNKEFDSKIDLMIMQDRDVIHIPYKSSLDSTIKWTTLVATVVSVLASVVLISEYKKSN